MKLKKLTALALAGLMTIGLTGCGNGGSFQPVKEGTLTVLTNSGYAPYEVVNTKGELEGFDVELVNLIAEKLNLNVEFVDMDFDGLITAVNSGRGDVVAAGLSPTAERGEAATLSDVYYKGDEETVNYVLARKDSGINSMADIKGKTVGVQIGTIQETAVTSVKDEYNLTLDNRKGYTDMVQEVLNKRMDFVVMEKAVADEHVALHDELQVWKLEAGEDSQGNVFAFKKGNDELKDKFNTAIKELSDSGELQKLVDKWFTDEAAE